MIDFLKYPKEYRVNKPLSVEKYLLSANLTKTEYHHVCNRICSIELLYDLPTLDGKEIIIIGLEVTNIDGIRLNTVTRSIAQSLPYSCVIILYVGNQVRLFVFKTRENKENKFRRVIEQSSSTDFFEINTFDVYSFDAVYSLKSVSFPILSEQETIEKWVDEFKCSRDSRKNNWYRKLMIKRHKEQEQLFAALLSAQEDESAVEADDDDVEFDEEKVLIEEYIDCLCEYAPILFDEWIDGIEKEDLDEFNENEIKWFTFQYLETSEDIIKELFDKELLLSQKRKIFNAILADEGTAISSLQILDIDVVRQNFLQQGLIESYV